MPLTPGAILLWTQLIAEAATAISSIAATIEGLGTEPTEAELQEALQGAHDAAAGWDAAVAAKKKE